MGSDGQSTSRRTWDLDPKCHQTARVSGSSGYGWRYRWRRRGRRSAQIITAKWGPRLHRAMRPKLPVAALIQPAAMEPRQAQGTK